MKGICFSYLNRGDFSVVVGFKLMFCRCFFNASAVVDLAKICWVNVLGQRGLRS